MLLSSARRWNAIWRPLPSPIHSGRNCTSANLALEYATKRFCSNCINWGMAPLLTEDHLKQLDEIFLPMGKAPEPLRTVNNLSFARKSRDAPYAHPCFFKPYNLFKTSLSVPSSYN